DGGGEARLGFALQLGTQQLRLAAALVLGQAQLAEEFPVGLARLYGLGAQIAIQAPLLAQRLAQRLELRLQFAFALLGGQALTGASFIVLASQAVQAQALLPQQLDRKST